MADALAEVRGAPSRVGPASRNTDNGKAGEPQVISKRSDISGQSLKPRLACGLERP